MKNQLLIPGIIGIVIIAFIAIALVLSNNKANTNQSGTSTTNPQTATPPTFTDGPCIITVLGNQYDVTEHRLIHPGGDIYVCGTDMTDIYVGQHGRSTSRIEHLKID